jgi:hypothetical protein
MRKMDKVPEFVIIIGQFSFNLAILWIKGARGSVVG